MKMKEQRSLASIRRAREKKKSLEENSDWQCK